MSTFKGVLNEDVFKGCVIDYFRNDALSDGRAFFLSHFHSDHMVGLEDVRFHQILGNGCKLYCSSITKKMLLKKRRLLGLPTEMIVVMEYPHPIVIQPYDVAIRVTPVRAGHCPGSMMFLFEACDTTALYTGDFRLSERDISLCKPLHDPDTHDVIKIHSLYLDTTFANTDYEFFPTREKSKDNIVRIMRERREDFKYFVIELTATTGIEFLMVEFWKEFKCQIHASFELCQNVLSCIDQLLNVTTTELNESFIHFCYGEVFNEKPNFARVAYSSHSSLCELAEFVDYLKPGIIYPSVVPSEMTADEVLYEIKSYRRTNITRTT